MLGIKDLKQAIRITDSTVECPVQGCPEMVVRRRKGDKRSDLFRCPRHCIYISPTRFEYESECSNLLWREADDAALWSAVKTVKRECRLDHNSSEDAVTWNVFRYLERTDQVAEIMSQTLGRPVVNPKLVYWSYSPPHNGVWPELARARATFGELPQRSSEPDLMISAEDAFYWIEAKLSANNGTSSKSEDAKRKYATLGDGWFDRVFKCQYDEIARNRNYYELMRLWLLGTWIAEHMAPRKHFVLLNLVCEGEEEDIADCMADLLRLGPTRHFQRITWEHIAEQIARPGHRGVEREVILDFFREKALGYDFRGQLQPAFRWKASWASQAKPEERA